MRIHRGIALAAAAAAAGSSIVAGAAVAAAPAVAHLRPFFFDNSPAVVANTDATDHGKTVALALTDPDSSEIVPAASPRFGGDFVLDSQGDMEQIYVHPLADRLSVLRLTQAVDDSAWATCRSGTLFVTDSADDALFAVTGHFRPGTAFVAVTPADANNPGPNPPPNYLGTLSLATGAVSAVPLTRTVEAKGLLFVS
jgi:hypothetical protein